MAFDFSFKGELLAPADASKVNFKYKFIYASPLNHTHLKLAKKLASRGYHVVIAAFAPTSQSIKSVISAQLPKWFASQIRVNILVHGGIPDKFKFEESYSNSFADWQDL